MASKTRSYIGNVRNAFRDVFASELVALIPEWGFELIPTWLINAMVAGLVTLFGSEFLKNNDRQQTIARLIAAFIPGFNLESHHLQVTFIEEVIEEGVKRQTEFGDDREENKQIARDIIAGRKSAMADKKDPKKDDKPAAPAAAPKPPELTLLQVVGGLEAGQQAAFWTTVNAVIGTLPTPAAKDDFMARVNRITLSKESVIAILAATPDDLRRQAMQQAVMQAFNAGGTAGGFRHILDATTNALSSALGGGQLDPDGLRKELEAGNTVMEQRHKRLRNIR